MAWYQIVSSTSEFAHWIHGEDVEVVHTHESGALCNTTFGFGRDLHRLDNPKLTQMCSRCVKRIDKRALEK